MTLPDHMLRAIRRAIIANPEKYSPALVVLAKSFENLYEDWWERREALNKVGRYSFGSYTALKVAQNQWQSARDAFEQSLAKHADELKSICTETV